MANKNPVLTKEFFENQRKAIGTEEKIGSKVFGVKLPLQYEDKLKSLPREDRVILMRSALMSAIDSLDNE